MSGKSTSAKTGPKKRDSKPPEPTGDSSDSGRSRSLSAGRTSSRRVETRKSTAARSKLNLSQYINESSSECSDKDFSDDKVARKPRFRRCKELKEVVKKENSAALSDYTIPKKSGKKAIKDMAFGTKPASNPETPVSAQQQSLLAPSGGGEAGDAGDHSLQLGTSGKVLGYKITVSETAEEFLAAGQNPQMYVQKGAQIPLRSKIGNGVYLPLNPDFGPGSGQPKLGPHGAGVRLSPYPKSKPIQSIAVSASVSAAELTLGGDHVVTQPGQNPTNAGQTAEKGPELPGGISDAAQLLQQEDTPPKTEADAEDASEEEPVAVDPNNIIGSSPRVSDLDYEPDELEIIRQNAAKLAQEGGDDGDEDEDEEIPEDGPGNLTVEEEEDLIGKEDSAYNSRESHNPPNESPNAQNGLHTDSSKETEQSDSKDIGFSQEKSEQSVADGSVHDTHPESPAKSPADSVHPTNRSLLDLNIFAQTKNNCVTDLSDYAGSPGRAGAELKEEVDQADTDQKAPGDGADEEFASQDSSPENHPPAVSQPASDEKEEDEDMGEDGELDTEDQRHSSTGEPLPSLNGSDSWNQECEDFQSRINSMQAESGGTTTSTPRPVPPPTFVPAPPKHKASGNKLVITTIDNNQKSDPKPEATKDKNKVFHFTAQSEPKTKPIPRKKITWDTPNDPDTANIPGPPPSVKEAKPGELSSQNPDSADNKAAGGAKSKRKHNPRPDLLVLPDIPLDCDTRRMGEGYVFVSKEKYALDKEMVTAAKRRARAEIAVKLFGTSDVATPTPTLIRFWLKTGVAKTKSLNEVVAMLINATHEGWTELYNNWTQLEEYTEAWQNVYDALLDLAIKIFTPKPPQPSKTSKTKKPAKSNGQQEPPAPPPAAADAKGASHKQQDKQKPGKQPRQQKKKTPAELAAEAKEAKIQEEIMKKGAELGFNFASKVRNNPPAASNSRKTEEPPQTKSGATASSKAAAAALAAAAGKPGSGRESNRSRRFDKVETEEQGDTNDAAKDSSANQTTPTVAGAALNAALKAAASAPSAPTKSLLKPVSGNIKKPSRKYITFAAEETDQAANAVSNKKIDQLAKQVQTKVDKVRQNQPDPEDVKKEGKGLKDRLGTDKALVDYTLWDLLNKQAVTHEPPKAPTPLPPTPDGNQMSEEEHDSGNHTGGASNADADDADDSIQVYASQDDMMFSPGRKGGSSKAESPVKLPDFDPTKPPPNFKKSHKSQKSQKSLSQACTSTDESGLVRKRVIVENIESSSILSKEDLETFRVRLEAHIFQLNRQMEKRLMPARNLPPWIERGKIVVVPADFTTGQFVIDLVNNRELVLAGRCLRSGWNLDLPEVAQISIKYELMGDHSPQTIVEDEFNGIIRQNCWSDVEAHEVSYLNANPHKTKAKVKFVRAIVSRKVVQHIKAQMGRIWICGGTATVQWNDKDLVDGLDVQFNYQ